MLEDVIALDRVQKKIDITEDAINRLRELKLIAGWYPNLQIIAENRPKNIPYSEYKRVILNFIEKKGSATREELENLIMPLLPQDLPIAKQQKKISNLITELSHKEGKIKNVSSSDKYSEWTLIM